MIDRSTPELQALKDRLATTWNNAPGIIGQLTAANHSTLGLRFIATGLAFLLIGGMLSMFMRLQLAWSDQSVLDHVLYNQFMTMHGTTMMFLFAVPEGGWFMYVPLSGAEYSPGLGPDF